MHQVAVDADPEVVVYVFAEVVKPEDVRAVAAIEAAPGPVLAVLNKADVTGFAGDGPMALARAQCEHFSALLGVPVQPMIGLPSGLDRVRWKASVISPQPSSTPRIVARRALADS